MPGHGNAVLVVGTSLDERSTSLSSLALALGVVGPIALLVAVAAGYRLTAATLRPVELMRRQAATVSASEPGVRLPLPTAEDEIHELGSPTPPPKQSQSSHPPSPPTPAPADVRSRTELYG